MIDYARRTARVLLVDGSGRLLLFGAVAGTGSTTGRGWFTPGGGVEPGETLADAAVRELAEETGLRISAEALGPHVAWCSGYAELGGIAGIFRDDFFLHRVDALDVVTDGMAAYETEQFTGYRWWTVDELEATGDLVYPVGLAELCRRFLRGDVPVDPVALRWKH